MKRSPVSAQEVDEFGIIPNELVEQAYGGAIDKRVEMLLLGDELLHREYGGWYLYPPPPCGNDSSS